MMLSDFNINFLKVQPAIVDFAGWAINFLLWGNILALLAQVDIPNEVWGQYPLILIGVVLVGWLARYWVANEREWRIFTTQQVTDRESANLRTLQLIQTNNEQWLKVLGENHKEQIELIEANHLRQLKVQQEELRGVFDSELERVLELLAKANSNGLKKMGGRSNDPT
jgi:hypothetical protein